MELILGTVLGSRFSVLGSGSEVRVPGFRRAIPPPAGSEEPAYISNGVLSNAEPKNS
jgi:hypothetical protein